ncbi:BQ5605_C017g08552 [Microbotryum silenes-dioicae]|uniref:BQ5605_C017g08552 protein n=1 Tax=Microbotryum silenes-dioicae TaxID=796604 RepID=A0A2X0NYL9_9BASI|nr:BQ5605_C017g08552 [Microbotryum silenes-dioicae]
MSPIDRSPPKLSLPSTNTNIASLSKIHISYIPSKHPLNGSLPYHLAAVLVARAQLRRISNGLPTGSRCASVSGQGFGWWAFWVCKGDYYRGKKKKDGTREAETCGVRLMGEGRGSEEREASLSFEEKGASLPAEKGVSFPVEGMGYSPSNYARDHLVVKNPAATDQISCVLSALTKPRKASHGAKRILQSDIEQDPSLSPHRNETAHLRRDNSLSAEEMTFLTERKRRSHRVRGWSSFWDWRKGERLMNETSQY